jgi:tripartite-type tricarboxylate transporter receptor subunit TctC
MNTAPYPNRAIVVVAPFPPGHVSDLHPRLLAPHVGATLGQPVVVENWPGASGTVALERLKDVASDGYTLMVNGFGGLAVSPHLVDVSYDPRTDFSAIIRLVSSTPLVLVVNTSLPVEDVSGLIALARKEPAKVRGGSFGVGSNSHLALTLFNRRTGLEIAHTAYSGGFETTEELAGSGFDVMFEFPPVIMHHIEARRLKPLAVTGDRRSSVLPDVPTLAEAGVPGVDITGWQGVIGPSGVRPEIITTLNSAFAQAQALPEVRRLEADGYPLDASTPEEFAGFITDEYERWGAFIRAEDIRITRTYARDATPHTIPSLDEGREFATAAKIDLNPQQRACSAPRDGSSIAGKGWHHPGSRAQG